MKENYKKFPLPKGKEWFRLPERLLNLEKLGRPYKEYTALLSQVTAFNFPKEEGERFPVEPIRTNNPLAYELENGIGDISFLYESKGVYIVVPGKDVKFDEKTTIDIDYYGSNGNPNTKVTISRRKKKETNEIVYVITTYENEDLTDGILNNTRIEIRMYN
jgi:hypothetical protein